MAPIPASDIPTLSLLYKLKKLSPTPAERPLLPGASSIHNDRIGLIRSDITTLQVGAIVNAANRSLLGGGGVDGAIHRTAGKRLLLECKGLGGCETGGAKITEGYDLPAAKVIHTVGPVYDEDDKIKSERLLRRCYESSLKLAVEKGVKTIAFSGISTGIYGYPAQSAALVACDSVRNFLDSEEGAELDKVVFVTFIPNDVNAYDRALPRVFPPATETSAEQQKAEDEETAEAQAKASKLPDVPTTDPIEPEHAQKKQKQEDKKLV